MYLLQYIEDFFWAQHDADGRRSFVAVERSMLDRLLGSEIYTEGWWLVVGSCKGRVLVEAAQSTLWFPPECLQPLGSTAIVFVEFVADGVLFIEVLMIFLGRIEL